MLACDARAIAQGAACAHKEIEELNDRIYKAVNAGEFEINCRGLSTHAQQYLESLGYCLIAAASSDQVEKVAWY